MEKNLSLNQLQQVLGKQNKQQNAYLQEYISKYFDEKTLFNIFQSEQNIFYPIIKKFFSDIKIYCKNDQYDIYSQETIKQKKQLVIRPFDWFEMLEKHYEINPQHDRNIQHPCDIELNKIELQQNNNALNPNHIYQPLSKQQLQSIQKKGIFISQKEGELPKVWQISEKFYASYEHMKKYFKQFNYSKVKKVWCSEESQIRIYQKKWERFGLSFCYWNLRDGLQTIFFDTPFHLLNCLIGIPITVKIRLTLACYFKQYLESSLKEMNLDQTNIFSQQDFLDRINAFDMQGVMIEKIQKLKWNQIHFIFLRNLKIYLQIECVKEFFNRNNDLKIKHQNSFKLQEDQFIFLLIFDYMKGKIEFCDNNISEIKRITQDCQFFIQYYKLNTFDGFLNKFSKKANKFSENKLWILTHDSCSKFERNKYFWKIISTYQITIVFLKNNCIKKIVNNILYGYLGLVVIFRKQNGTYSHKTIYTMFQEIKAKVKSNIQKRIDENQEQAEINDDGGIFGDCCSRLPFATYFFNYLCIYFFYGIIFVNIFLRIIGIIFILLQFLYLILFYAISILIFLLQYLISILVYDEQNQSQLNIPCIFPLFSILILNPILGILKIMLSCFKFVFYLIQILAMKIRAMPKRLKNCLTFLIMKLFSQVPHRDSSYCYQIETQQDYQQFQCREESSYQLNQNQKPDSCLINMQNAYQKKQMKLNYFSAEQIKLFIDFELDYKYMEFLVSQLDSYTKQQQIQTETAISKVYKNLPFSDKQIITDMKTKMNNFQQQMKQIIELKFKKEFEIQFNEGCTLVYEKDQLDKIYQSISEYLTLKQSQSPLKMQNIYQQIQINGSNNYLKLTEYFLQKMFSKYLPKNSQQPLYFQLLKSSQFDSSNPNPIQEINKYLNESFFQEKYLLTYQNLNLQVLLEKVKSHLNLSKIN